MPRVGSPNISARQLKRQLKMIGQSKNNVLSPDERFRLAVQMTRHIGSPDSELRDTLIQGTFYKWIINDNKFRSEHLKNLLGVLTDRNHLFYRLGEHSTDSVFTRSFSVLTIAEILTAHHRNPFLNSVEIKKTKTEIIRYLKGERDLRGFVPVKGWSHAVAHSADALNKLAQCQELDRGDLAEIIDIIRTLATAQEMAYNYGEDERLVTAAKSVLQRNLLTKIEIESWIKSFSEDKAKLSLPEKIARRFNKKNFLRGLFFRRSESAEIEPFREFIAAVLRQIAETEGF